MDKSKLDKSKLHKSHQDEQRKNHVHAAENLGEQVQNEHDRSHAAHLNSGQAEPHTKPAGNRHELNPGTRKEP